LKEWKRELLAIQIKEQTSNKNERKKKDHTAEANASISIGACTIKSTRGEQQILSAFIATMHAQR
jgi:uncharacterized UPF0146 family protein